MTEVLVLDLGVGNLGNLERALRAVGAHPLRTNDPDRVASAQRLVLPGVGAFRPPRERLAGELERALRAAVARGAWLLGICVGFQLLFEGSEEGGWTPGLGWFSGQVVRLPSEVSLPQIGWNALEFVQKHPLLAGIFPGSCVYFVHSYAPIGAEPGEVVATAVHGRRFPAMVGCGRVAGVQFHPERSGEVGLRMLRNFVSWEGSWKSFQQ